jgi:hypothetical protein
VDPRNTFQYVQEQGEEMMQSGKRRFTSTVLIGGLFPRRDITDEVIKDFDLKFQEYMYYQGSSDANARMDAKEELGKLSAKHFRTLWEMEDNCALTEYLQGIHSSRGLRMVMGSKWRRA